MTKENLKLISLCKIPGFGVIDQKFNGIRYDLDNFTRSLDVILDYAGGKEK